MVSIKKLGIGGGVSFVFGILLWCGFPGLIRSQIKKVSEYNVFNNVLTNLFLLLHEIF